MEFFKILEDLTSLLRGIEQDTWITMFGNVDQHDDKVSTLKAEIPKDIDHLIEKAFQSKLHQVKAQLPKQIHVIEKAFQAKVKDLKWELHTTMLTNRIKVVEFKENNYTKMHILIKPNPMPKRRIKDHHNNQTPSNIIIPHMQSNIVEYDMLAHMQGPSKTIKTLWKYLYGR
ncbi:hypothetical protein RHGRI_031120 [Rhododendron griersonianum]|uniref:Uncharacterized protein n=1 Tax=Rhododendron griersonianum TaxID=479676 RepID=A0AAV6I6M2_9ERIC|nr:hypothetical protein RHGRI_031120 [Rhododendron griersonianum]